jgi:hypothetical protein
VFWLIVSLIALGGGAAWLAHEGEFTTRRLPSENVQMGAVARIILFLGDSLTASGFWQNITLEDATTAGKGWKGKTIAFIMEQAKALLDSVHPTEVVLLAGVNNIQAGHGVDRIKDELRTAWAQIHAAGAKVWAVKLTPWFGYRLFDNAEEGKKARETTLAVNAFIDEMKGQEGGPDYVIDTAELSDAKGRLLKKFSWDGLHMVGRGYMKLGEIMQSALQTQTPAPDVQVGDEIWPSLQAVVDKLKAKLAHAGVRPDGEELNWRTLTFVYQDLAAETIAKAGDLLPRSELVDGKRIYFTTRTAGRDLNKEGPEEEGTIVTAGGDLPLPVQRAVDLFTDRLTRNDMAPVQASYNAKDHTITFSFYTKFRAEKAADFLPGGYKTGAEIVYFKAAIIPETQVGEDASLAHGRTAKCKGASKTIANLRKMTSWIHKGIITVVTTTLTGGRGSKELMAFSDKLLDNAKSLQAGDLRLWFNTASNGEVAAWGFGTARARIAKLAGHPHDAEAKLFASVGVTKEALEGDLVSAMKATFAYFFVVDHFMMSEQVALHVMQACAILLYGGVGVVPVLNAALKEAPKDADGKRVDRPAWLAEVVRVMEEYRDSHAPAAADVDDVPDVQAGQVPPVDQETPWTCGPAALRADLAHWGCLVEEGWLANFLGNIAVIGVRPRMMLKGARKLGFNAALSYFANVEALRPFLAHDVPVIVVVDSFLHPGKQGHYVVVTEVGPDTVTLMDPHFEGNKRVLSYADFDARWWNKSPGPDGLPRIVRRLGIVVVPGTKAEKEPADPAEVGAEATPEAAEPTAPAPTGRTAKLVYKGMPKWLDVMGKIQRGVSKAIVTAFSGGLAAKAWDTVQDQLMSAAKKMHGKELATWYNNASNEELVALRLGQLREAVKQAHEKKSKEVAFFDRLGLTDEVLSGPSEQAMEAAFRAELLEYGMYFQVPWQMQLHGVQALAILLYGGPSVLPLLDARLKVKPRNKNMHKEADLTTLIDWANVTMAVLQAFKDAQSEKSNAPAEAGVWKPASQRTGVTARQMAVLEKARASQDPQDVLRAHFLARSLGLEDLAKALGQRHTRMVMARQDAAAVQRAEAGKKAEIENLNLNVDWIFEVEQLKQVWPLIKANRVDIPGMKAAWRTADKLSKDSVFLFQADQETQVFVNEAADELRERALASIEGR